MDNRKALDAPAMGIMVVLCLTWGLQQVVMKLAAADVSPLMQIALRSGIAALLVGLVMARRGERLLPDDGSGRPGLLVGVLFALEFLFLGEGLRFTSASHAVVFLYTAPIFVALGLHWRLPAERLAAGQWLGVGLAFGGIALTFLGREQAVPQAAPADMLWGDFLALLAGIAWAATTLAVRLSCLSGAPATLTLLYQLLGGFFLLVPAAAALGQAGFVPTPLAWGSLLFHGLIVSFASYLAWFWLLRKYLASRLGVFSFLTPLFGVAFGVWLLDEPLEANFLVGALLVCAGIVLVSGNGWLVALLARRRKS
jgi:drug/metabolite transporter (DMT)-like permease